MRRLHIDIETYSPVSLRTGGLYKYAEKCEILLFAYAFDDEPVKCIDMVRDTLPQTVRVALTDPDFIKIAHNAAFERACISAYTGIELPVDQWVCSMIRCAIAGLPLMLEHAAVALGSRQQKDKRGKSLISFFCIPRRPTKNDNRSRNMPHDDTSKWIEFKNYCIQDVETERENYRLLSYIKIPRTEHALYGIDQIINARGILIDQKLVNNAIELDDSFRQKIIAEAMRITGVANPNSVKQLKRWLDEAFEKETEDRQPEENYFDYAQRSDYVADWVESGKLDKKTVPELLKYANDSTIKRVLTIRQELSKTSVKKYVAMLNALCDDGRIRGLLQFYGANRTGRWAGRLVQVQNLPKSKFHDTQMDFARNLVLAKKEKKLDILFGPVGDALSQLIRTAIVAAPGKRLIVSDFSAIEARVIAWLAGEKWRLEVFNTHGRIYEASAAQMFKIPIESVTKSSDYRAKAKIAELALGFGGNIPALVAMGALEMGLSEDELQEIVIAWREANPMIKLLWKDVQKCAITAIKTGAEVTLRNIVFKTVNKNLTIRLPSGRRLYYFNVSLIPGHYGDEIVYQGLDQTSKKWVRIKTYGGKLVENIVQATARDCLANGLITLHEAGYNIVMHVHDEIVCEEKKGRGSLEEVNRLLASPAPWMRGLPLAAEGYEGHYYKKD